MTSCVALPLARALLPPAGPRLPPFLAGRRAVWRRSVAMEYDDDRKSVMKNYVLDMFFFDLFTSIPVRLNFQNPPTITKLFAAQTKLCSPPPLPPRSEPDHAQPQRFACVASLLTGVTSCVPIPIPPSLNVQVSFFEIATAAACSSDLEDFGSVPVVLCKAFCRVRPLSPKPPRRVFARHQRTGPRVACAVMQDAASKAPWPYDT